MGWIVLLLPVTLGLVLATGRVSVDKRHLWVLTAAGLSLGLLLGYSLVNGLAPGETWGGIAILAVAPYLPLLVVVRIESTVRRPGFLVVLIPIVYAVSLLIIMLVLVNLRLMGPPF